MDHQRAHVEQIIFFQELNQATIKALAMIAIPLRQETSTMIQLMDEPAEVMYVVVQGQVKITRPATNGREQVLHVVMAGRHLNDVLVFDGGAVRHMP